MIKSGSLTLVTDDTGQFPYRVPISCINDPLRYIVQDTKDILEDKNKPEETELEGVKIRNVKEADTLVTISNHALVSELKSQYLSEVGKDDSQNMRMLYGGKELKDDLPLYHYNVSSDWVIICMYK